MIKTIKNFLNKKELKDVHDYFDWIVFQGGEHSRVFESKTQQVPNALCFYGNIVANYIMITKQKVIEKKCGFELLPTYSYVRHYTNKMELKKHIDRPSCEISYSLNIWQDYDWPLFFKIDSKIKEYIINPGDIVIYEGSKYPHWRESYPGESCLQMFVHYVRKKGQNTKNYLDGFGHLEYPKKIFKKW